MCIILSVLAIPEDGVQEESDDEDNPKNNENRISSM